MKKINYLMSTLFLALSISLCQFSYGQDKEIDLQELVGTWKLDLSPEKTTDSNFALMKIDSISDNLLVRVFNYRSQ